MSRYLTPAKIGLLALIELYVGGAVPNAAICPIIDFLASHLLDCDLQNAPEDHPALRWKKVESSMNLILSIKDFEKLLLAWPAADKIPGLRLWDRFLQKLWDIDSLYELHAFFDWLPNLLVKTKDEMRRMEEMEEELPGPEQGVMFLLSKTSPLGSFIRKAYMEFVRMQYHHEVDLWKMFVKYRQPTASYWKRRHPSLGRFSFDSVLVEGEHEWGVNKTMELAVGAYGTMLLAGNHEKSLPVSTDDVEGLLEWQIDQIQKYGNRIPREITERFQRLVKDSHLVPSLSHYLSFSDAWRSGDFPTSFDYLHRYFDYTMQNRDRTFYQYALMNLAIVQSDFGCHKEAVSTMLETVATARENRDMTCLNFALNWFFHFGRAHPKLVRELENNSMLGSGKESLAFLRAKAKETGMWILWSSSLLSEAKLNMANGESISAAIEHIVRSSQVIVERNMKTMMGAQISMLITLWDRLGLAPLSTMESEVFLKCHATNSVFDDELRITCRLAGLLAGKGKYQEAFERLENMNANSMRSAKPHQYWNLYRALLKLRRDLHHNNLFAANAMLSQLLQTGPEDLEPDLVCVIDSLHLEALIRSKDFENAFVKIDTQLHEMRENNRDIALRVRLLLAKAQLFDCVGRPEKGFSVAMRAASMSWRARLITLLWQSMGAVANILTSLGEFEAAEGILVAVLPRVLEADVSFTSGTLYSLLADARMGRASKAALNEKNDLNNKKRNEFLLKAHEALESALKHFAAVEDLQKQCEMLAKIATIMRALGDRKVAEDYAARYVALKREAAAIQGS
ncbi:putative anaphase-promoting complex subunit 5 [Podospora fimiseda]|uniref:Anaphase-promoting complex subunit 5 n=1 Tax=Podospora fimiseda TaxID=252190 RepID=A0AAN7BZF7_9PEZI|nr:putative anaphase-promoting complex subunit 5 [Podospora fimiseda]